MNLILITTVLVIQTYILYLFRKRKTFGVQWLISLGFLLMYWYVFPELLIYFSDVGDLECGMFVVAIYLGSSIYGTGVTILSTGLGYLVWSRAKQKGK